jgi:hypothetical protein
MAIYGVGLKMRFLKPPKGESQLPNSKKLEKSYKMRYCG